MRDNDPIRGFRFTVECDGIQKAGFSEITGFDISIEAIEYREGNEQTTVRKLPGLTKYSNITLKAGVIDETLYEWIKDCTEGTIERQMLTINALGEGGDEVMATWTIEQAWPVKYTAPEFKASGNDIAVESVELAHEGLKRTK